MGFKEFEIEQIVPGEPEEVYQAYIKHCWRGQNKIIEEGNENLVGNVRQLFGFVNERILSTLPGQRLEYTIDNNNSLLESYLGTVEFGPVDDLDSEDLDKPTTKISWRSEMQSANSCFAMILSNALPFYFKRQLVSLKALLEDVQREEIKVAV